MNGSNTPQKITPNILPWILPAVVGIAMGALAYIASGLPLKWATVILVAAAAPMVALFVKDIRKLILVVLTVDIPLGVDIALRDQEWHQGGPTGYIISLMTFGIIIGYALWILEKKPRFRFFSPLTWPVFLYLGAIILSMFQSSYLELSLFGAFLNIQFILYYLYLANHVQTWDSLRTVMITATILLLLESIYMLLQYYFGISLTLGFLPGVVVSGSPGVSGIRVGGTIGTPNSAAIYLATMMVLTLGAYSTGKLLGSKLTFTVLGFSLVALIITMTRTAWGAVGLMGVLLIPWLWRTALRKVMFPALIVMGIIALLLFGQQIIARAEAIKTDATRSELAYMALNIIQAYPMGVGENNYDQVMSDRYAHPNWIGHTHYPVHNKYLLIWAENGPLGLIAFVVLLVSALWQAGRYAFKKDLDGDLAVLPASLFAVCVGYALHMVTEGFASRPNLQVLWFIFALIMAVNSVIDRQLRQQSTTANMQKRP
jgi:O-antigen ligase